MNVIITGSTGMVGRGILLECIAHPQVHAILVINRNPLDLEHPKVKELLVKDFSQFDSVKEQLIGYDACFHSMGVSSVAKSEEEFNYYTYMMTKSLVDALYAVNKQMTFCYVSGKGSDSSEHGPMMWARVKGKTENLVLNKGFSDAYAFRPGIIIPEKGIKSKTNWYQAFYMLSKPLYPLLKKVKSITTTSRIGLAMINSVAHPTSKKHLESQDINLLAEQQYTIH